MPPTSSEYSIVREEKRSTTVVERSSTIVTESSTVVRNGHVTRSSRRSEKVALAFGEKVTSTAGTNTVTAKTTVTAKQEKATEGRMVSDADYSVETWMRLREGTKGGMETELAKVEQLLLNRGALSLEKSLCISLLQAQKVMTSWSRPRELFALNRPSDNDTTPSTPRSETKGCNLTLAADVKCPMNEELAFWKRLREKLSKLEPETAANFSELPKLQFCADNVTILPPFCGLIPEGLPSEQRTLEDIWRNDVTAFERKEDSDTKMAQSSHQTNNTNGRSTNGRKAQEDIITAAGILGSITWEQLNEKFEKVETLLVETFNQASDYLKTFDVLLQSMLAIAATGIIDWLKMEPQEILEALRVQANAITQAAWVGSDPEKAKKTEIMSLGVSTDRFLEPWKRLREAGNLGKSSEIKADLQASETKVSQNSKETGQVLLGSGKEEPTQEFHRVRELFIQAFSEGLFGIQVDNVSYVSKHLTETVMSRAQLINIEDIQKWLDAENFDEKVQTEKFEDGNKNELAKTKHEDVPNDCSFRQTLEKKIVESVGSIQNMVCYFLDENEILSKETKKDVNEDDDDFEVKIAGYFPKEKYPKVFKTNESKQDEFSMRDLLKSNFHQLSGCPLEKVIKWMKTEGEILTAERNFSENCEQNLGASAKCKLEKKMYLAAAAFGFIEWLIGNVDALDSALFEYADVVRHIAKMLNSEIEHVNKNDEILLGCEKDSSSIAWTRLRESWKSNEVVKALIQEETTRHKFMQKPGKTVSNILALSCEVKPEVFQRPRELFMQDFMSGKLELQINGTSFAADKMSKIILSRALNCDLASIERWFKVEEMKADKKNQSENQEKQLIQKDTIQNYCDHKSTMKKESMFGKGFGRKLLMCILDVTMSHNDVNKKSKRSNRTSTVYSKAIEYRTENVTDNQKNVHLKTSNVNTTKNTNRTGNIVIYGRNMYFKSKTTDVEVSETENEETETIVVYGRNLNVKNKTPDVEVSQTENEETETIVVHGRNLNVKNKTPDVEVSQTENEETETIVVHGRNLNVKNKTPDVEVSETENEETETIVVYGRNLNVKNKTPDVEVSETENDETESIVVYGRNLNVQNKTPDVEVSETENEETETIVVYGRNLNVKNKTPDVEVSETENEETESIVVYGRNLNVQNKTPDVEVSETENEETETIVVYGRNLNVKNKTPDVEVSETENEETETIVVYGNDLCVKNKTSSVQILENENEADDIVVMSGKDLLAKYNSLNCQKENGTESNESLNVHSRPLATSSNKNVQNEVELSALSDFDDEVHEAFLDVTDDESENTDDVIKLPAKLSLPEQKNEKPNIDYQKDFSMQNLLKYFTTHSSAFSLEEFVNWVSESSQILPTKTNFAETLEFNSGPKGKFETNKVLFSAMASFGFIEWLFGNVELLDPALFEHAEVVRHISKVLNSAIDQIIREHSLQFGFEAENAMIAWIRLRESIKSSEGIKLLPEMENTRAGSMQQPRTEPINILAKPCEEFSGGYFRPREMFIDAFLEGKIETIGNETPFLADLLTKAVFSRGLKKEMDELEKWLSASVFTEWQGKPAKQEDKVQAKHEILDNSCLNTQKLLCEHILGKSFTEKLFTYILDVNLSAEESTGEKKSEFSNEEDNEGVIKLPAKLSLNEKNCESKIAEQNYQENFSVQNLLTYFTNSTTALSLSKFIDWSGVSSQIMPVQKKSAEQTDLISSLTSKCSVEKTLFLAAASFGFIEWLFGDVEILKDALFEYAQLLKQISELLPASSSKILDAVNKLAHEERDGELSWIRLREKEIHSLACKSDIQEQPVSVVGRIIGSNYVNLAVTGRAKEEILADFARTREIWKDDPSFYCSSSVENERLSLEDKLQKIVAMSYGLGLREDISTIWNDLNSMKIIASNMPRERSAVSISEDEKLKKLEKPKEEEILEKILNGLGKESGIVKYFEAEEDVEVTEFLTMPIEEQLLMSEKQHEPSTSKQFSDAFAQVECQLFETASSTDVMSKQELIAELMHTLCGGLKSLHAGSFQNVAAFKRHANSWFAAKPERTVANSSLSDSPTEDETLEEFSEQSYMDIADDLSYQHEIEKLELLQSGKYEDLVKFFIQEKLLDSGKWFDDVEDLFLDLPTEGSKNVVFQDHENSPENVEMTVNNCNMLFEETESEESSLKKTESFDDWQSADITNSESVEKSDWLPEDLVENVLDTVIASGKDEYLDLLTCEEKPYEDNFETNVLETFSENAVLKEEQFDETEAMFNGIAKSEEAEEYKFAKDDLQAVETLSLPFEQKLETAEISNRYHQMSIQASEAFAEHELRLIQTALLSSDGVSKYEVAGYSGKDSCSEVYELSVSNMDEWQPMCEESDSSSDAECTPRVTRQYRWRELIGVPSSSTHTNLWQGLDHDPLLTQCDPQVVDNLAEDISQDQELAQLSSTSARDELCQSSFDGLQPEQKLVLLFIKAIFEEHLCENVPSFGAEEWTFPDIKIQEISESRCFEKAISIILEIEEERIVPEKVREVENPTHRLMSHEFHEKTSTYTGSFDASEEGYSSVFEYDSDNGSDEWASADEGKFPVGEEDDSCPPSPIVFEDEHCDENSLLPVQTATRVDLDFNEDQRDVITRQSVPQAIFEIRSEVHEKDQCEYDIKTDSFIIDPAVINNMIIKVTRDSKTESQKHKVDPAAINNMTIKVTRDSSKNRIETQVPKTEETSENQVNAASINKMTIKVTRDSSRHKTGSSDLNSSVNLSPRSTEVDPAAINKMTIKVTRDSSRHKLEGHVRSSSAAVSPNLSVDAASIDNMTIKMTRDSSKHRLATSDVTSENLQNLKTVEKKTEKNCDAANINNMRIKVTRKSNKQKRELRNLKTEHYGDDIISGEYHLEHAFMKKWESCLVEECENKTMKKLFLDQIGCIEPPSTKMNVCVSRKQNNREISKEKFRSRSRSLPREQEVEHV